MTKYCARICWNSYGWIFPSGEAKELEKGTHVARSGFGSEEWLFSFAWQIDGYHHAFLQPVHDSYKKVRGKTLDILLYSINQSRDRVYVGEIKNCIVLMPEQKESTLKYYKKRGWFGRMKAQIEKVGGDSSMLKDEFPPFNIKFRTEDLELYQPQRLARPSDLVTHFNYYKLVKADREIIVREWQRRKGTKTPPSIRTITRSGHQDVIYDPIHAELQEELMELLRARFGKRAVLREEDFVDISVRYGKRTILIEIKSDPDARLAIRKGLGQILEYSYFHNRFGRSDPALFIIAPAPTNEKVSAYVDMLRSRFRLPVTYCSFSLGDELPAALSQSTDKHV